MKETLWMQPYSSPQCAHLALYRCIFETAVPAGIHIRFSADERAQLFLDGEFLTEGPERGAREYWYYRDLTFDAGPGRHTFLARVSAFPGDWEYSQMSIRPGFYCEDHSGLLKTWECRIEEGVFFEKPFPDWAAGPRVHVTKRYGSGRWEPVRFLPQDRVLHAPDLPEMRHERIVPERRGKGLYYFPRYSCCRTVWHFRGHGQVKVRWSETPYLSPKFDPDLLQGEKGKRDGTVFIGNHDVFDVDGTLDWRDFQWRAGHYVETEVSGEVTVEPEFYATGYPLPEYRGDSAPVRAAVETLRACAHETFMDCPYYERLLYAGDSRLEAIALYRLTDDHRLAAKTLRMLLASQRPDGSILTQYPSRLVQIIPSFMPIFVLSFHDYWKRHKEDPMLGELKPKLRKLVDYLTGKITPEGLRLPGWQFLDWCGEPWKNGVPPGNCGVSLLGVLALRAASEIFGDPGLAETAEKLAETVRRRYYVPEKRLFADDAQKRFFSEHAQSLAVLAGFPEVRPDAPGLMPCSIYFSYYYLSACAALHREDLIRKRLARWEEVLREGLTTFPEEFGVTRSDCHAWGSYILDFLPLTQDPETDPKLKEKETGRQ